MDANFSSFLAWKERCMERGATTFIGGRDSCRAYAQAYTDLSSLVGEWDGLTSTVYGYAKLEQVKF